MSLKNTVEPQITILINPISKKKKRERDLISIFKQAGVKVIK